MAESLKNSLVASASLPVVWGTLLIDAGAPSPRTQACIHPVIPRIGNTCMECGKRVKRQSPSVRRPLPQGRYGNAV